MIDTFTNVALEVIVFWSPFLLLMLVGFQVQKYYLTLLSKVGGRTLVMIPASFSVPIHEISHLIVAKACGHNIVQVRLFSLNNSGTMGFIKHEYKTGIVSIFTNMLIGLAPLAGGVIMIWILTYLLMPENIQVLQDTDMVTSSNILDVAYQYFEGVSRIAAVQWSRWEFLLWCFFVAHIAVFSVPSSADFAGAGWGICFTVAAYLLVMFGLGSNNHIHNAFIALATTLSPIFILSIILIASFMPPLYFIYIIKSKRKKM